MARTAAETANILREIYDDGFSGEESEPYRLGWDQLRGIAGVGRLTDEVIAGIGKLMLDSGYFLVPFDNFLLVGMEADYRHTRKLSARLAESYLAIAGNESELENEDLELGDGDDVV